MRRAVLLAIRLYQRYLSPYKGFSCAYRVHTGHASCSALGYRAVRRHGIFRGLGLLNERTYRCGVVHRRHHPAPIRHHASQRGDCDPGCDLPCHCELPDGKGLAARVCDVMECCECADCGWSERRDKEKRRDRKRRDRPVDLTATRDARRP